MIYGISSLITMSQIEIKSISKFLGKLCCFQYDIVSDNICNAWIQLSNILFNVRRILNSTLSSTKLITLLTIGRNHTPIARR